MTIDIKGQLKFLKELQVIDIHLSEIEEEISSIPDLIEEAKSDWATAKTELDGKLTEKEASEHRKKDLETGLEDSKIHLQQREEKLYAIKTNKEYQAALKEIADGKRSNRAREDEIITLMETIETLSQEMTQLSSIVSEKETEFKTEEAELVAKKTEIENELGARADELKKIKGQVDKEVLEKYEFIRSRYVDPLAAVINGVCQGCSMNIPPQMFIELLKGVKFHSCPNCYRMIHPADEAESKEAEPEAKGS